MGLSQSATALVAIFAFCLVAVTAQLVYVLWWKRRFLRQSIAKSDFETYSSHGGDPTATSPTSKELLYFFLFCPESKQFRAPPLPPIDDVALKWSIREENLLTGPSETLFTIAEDCSSEADHRRTVEIAPRESISMEDHVNHEGMEHCFVVTDQNNNEVGSSSHYDHDGRTPFCTTCASPPFYTPSPSPVHDGH